jgi:ankyrin repeat protein
LFGEETTHWPKGEFRLIKISVDSEPIKNLLSTSGAVYLCTWQENQNFLFSSDFDLDRFRAGLLDIQNKEKNQAAEANDDDEKIFTALMIAAEWGDLASVQLLLENGANPAALNDLDGNALMLAAAAGHVEIVRLLLTYDVEEDALDLDVCHALSKATAAGMYKVCELLLAHGARLDIYTNNTEIPLHVAAKNGYTDLCELFIQHGSHINRQDEYQLTPLLLAAQYGHLDACKLLLFSGADIHQEKSTDHSLLINALIGGNLELVEYLIAQGASIEGQPDSNTPLIEATKRKHIDIVKTLLTKGAAVNRRDSLGRTALYFACANNSLETVTLLLQAGADPNLAIDNEYSPLFGAASRGSVPIFNCLLQKEVSFFPDPNMAHKALTAATRGGHFEMVVLLLKYGANPKLTNSDRDSPLFAAVAAGSVPLFTLLMQHGAPFFSDQLLAHHALTIAVDGGYHEMVTLLLQAQVPVEIVPFNPDAQNLLIIAMQNLEGDALTNMLSLLLKHHIPLTRTNYAGNDALMLAVQAKNIKAMHMLLDHGALIGQINTEGKNALTIAVDALDDTAHETGLAMASDAMVLAILVGSLQRQHNFFELFSEAINRAEHLLTREILLLDCAWYFLNKELPTTEIVTKRIQSTILLNFIVFVLEKSPAKLSQKAIDDTLGYTGICPPLIEAMRPYIAALPQIKFKLFGSSQEDIDKLNRIYLSGIFATLEQIRARSGDNWAPFQIDDANDTVFKTLNQIANIELNSFTQIGLETESLILNPVFETLFETCFNQSFAKATLPVTFPDYPAVTGKIAATLMKSGVYAAFATMIEAAWQKAWAIFTGTPMSSGSSISSNSTDSSSASSSSSSTETENLIELHDWIGEQIFYNNKAVPARSASFPESPQGQALLKAFRDQLLLAVEETGKTILDLPEATPEDARVYAELMHRQLYMLMQFIQAE